MAAVYENNDGKLGKFIGYYEVLDTGGQKIRSGKSIDIWMPTLDECMKFGRKKVLVKYLKGKG